MHNKRRLFCLCALLGCTLAACSSPQKQELQGSNAKTNATRETREKTDGEKEDHDKAETSGAQGTESPKPILDADATDEELLELVKDDINVVAQKDFVKTVRDIKEHMEKYSGQIYQMEGFYTKKDEMSYITDILEGEAGECLPLRYLAEEPEEGAQVRITGVISEGESEEGKDAGVALEVVVLELLEK